MVEILETEINFTYLVQVFPASKGVWFIRTSGFLIIFHTVLAILGLTGHNSKKNCKIILLPTLFIHLLNFFQLKIEMIYDEMATHFVLLIVYIL
jgi:hypothetical protein